MKTGTGLYIHIPFCARKCRYCDFYSVVAPERHHAFAEALQTEIRLRRAPDLAVDSIHFGGGTPSLLHPRILVRLLEALRVAFDVVPDAEIALEANPGSLDPPRLAALRAAGFNRLNLGLQAFCDASLQFLGRIHSAAEGTTAFRQARAAGFANLGLDLIYGLPGQRPAAWRRELEQALALAPAHIACYLLSYEAGTPLERDRRQGKLQPLSEADQVRLFDTTRTVLARGGYLHYEISNFARGPEYRSRHNLKYWTGAPYLGFGPGAHGYQPPERFWNAADLDRYEARLARGQLPTEGVERLTPAQEMLEALFLGLRLSEGVQRGAFQARFGVALEDRFGALIDRLVGEGLLVWRGEACTLSSRGMRLHDSVSALFADAL